VITDTLHNFYPYKNGDTTWVSWDISQEYELCDKNYKLNLNNPVDWLHTQFYPHRKFRTFCVLFKYPIRIFCDKTVIFNQSRPSWQTQSNIPHPLWRLSLWSQHDVHLKKEAHDESEERKAGFDGRSSVEERTVGTLVRAAHIADVQIEVVVRCVHGRVVHTWKQAVIALKIVKVYL